MKQNYKWQIAKLFVLGFALVTLTVLCVSGFATRASAQTYTLESFDPPGSACTSQGRINDDGTITGGYFTTPACTGGQGCFVRTLDKTINTFDGGFQVCAGSGINNKGVITGIVGNAGDDGCHFSGMQTMAFVRAPNGILTPFEVPSSTNATGRSINKKGDIVGYFSDSGCTYHGFVRHVKDGTITVIDIKHAGTGDERGTYAYGINDKGLVTGKTRGNDNLEHGFVINESLQGPGKRCGKACQIFDIPGSQYIAGNCINRNGTVAGSNTDAEGVNHGFIRTKDGTITPIDYPGAQKSPVRGTIVYCINDGGDVAGIYLDAMGNAHGFVRLADNTFIPVDFPAAVITNAYGINNERQISGNYVDGNNVTHGYIGVLSTK